MRHVRNEPQRRGLMSCLMVLDVATWVYAMVIMLGFLPT